MKTKYLQPQQTLEDEIKAIGYYFELCRKQKKSIHTSARSMIRRYDSVMDWVRTSKMSRAQFNFFLTEGMREVAS